MNPLLRTAMTYTRELATTLKSPQVRSQLQAVLQSSEMKTLITTIRDSARGVTATPAAQDSLPNAQNQSSPDDDLTQAPAPAMTGRSRRRARAKHEFGDS